MWKRIACCTILGLLLAMAAGGGEEAAEPTEAELIERILELQRRIDELLARLPPEVREELRRRLAAGETTAAGDEPEPAAEETATAVAGAASPPPAATALPEKQAASVPAATAVPETKAVPETAATRAAPPAATGLWSAPRRPPRERCNTLVPLDENGDGQISSADRYWRHLFVWIDRNGDGQMQEREIESVYDRKVREIDVALETFSRVKGSLGEIRLTERVVLDLRGDGFSERARGDDGVLLLDAGAIRRGDGPELLGPAGESLDGIQPFRAGLSIRDAAGAVVALECPRSRTGED